MEEPDFTNALKPIQSPNLEDSDNLSPLSNTNNNRGSTFFNEPISQPIMNRPNFVEKPIPTLRPQAPPVRIDTCIVGDESTCEIDKHEVCLAHLGVSTCDCRPGYGRKDYRKSCKSKYYNYRWISDQNKLAYFLWLCYFHNTKLAKRNVMS